MTTVRMPSPPSTVPPPGACDCHTHVFGPGSNVGGDLAYPLPDAPLPVHRAMRDTIGVERGVLIQPSAYGRDHGSLIDAIAHSDGRLCGVGLADETSTDRELDDLASAGVRALRFVETRVPGTGGRYPGNVPIAALDPLRDAMGSRDWHAELWAPLPQAADICDSHAGLGIPIVLDHLGGVTADTPADDPDFRRILRHVERGHVWVKLVLCRTARTLEEARATRPLHDALLAANPHRLVWGTDFPFIRKGDDAPDAGELLDLVAEWAGPHAERILTANPASLYRFPSQED